MIVFCPNLSKIDQTLAVLQKNGPSIGVTMVHCKKISTEVKMATGVKVISVMPAILGFSAGSQLGYHGNRVSDSCW